MDDDFGLLEALGAECAGAVALTVARRSGSTAQIANDGGVRWLDDDALAQLVQDFRNIRFEYRTVSRCASALGLCRRSCC